MIEYPLFPKTYDLIVWLLPHTQKFPKSQRFVLAKRVEDAALNFQALIIKARKVTGEARAETLVLADVELETLRLSLRLCQEMKLLSLAQYEHVSKMLVEIGKLLGAWRSPKEKT
jgi:23S rRNA-intervening sequence protein